MECRIKILPELIASQIKAGEVVETPASVVKEMMENSIDAGARNITVNIRNLGRDLIQIVDDGMGMTANEAVQAFLEHATSKISSLDDIYALQTFGFRGEALSSIAAISEVELLTRTLEEEVGTRVVMQGGKLIDKSPVATKKGTQFLVKNIFYNTPARRKFIDSRQHKISEQIRNEFRKIAITNHEVAMQLIVDGQTVYTLSPSNLAERITSLFGQAVKGNLLEVKADTSIVKISGFIGNPKDSRRSSGLQYMFANGRFFRSPYMHKAVMKAYEKLIADGNIPSYFLFFEVAPERLDQNIHAQKLEVQFADEKDIWQILNSAVRETLAKTGVVSLMDFDQTVQVEIPVADQKVNYAFPRSTTKTNYDPFREMMKQRSNELHGSESVSSVYETFDETYDSPSNDEISQTAELSNKEQFEYIDSSYPSQMEMNFSEEPTFEKVMLLGGSLFIARNQGRIFIGNLQLMKQTVLFETYLGKLHNHEGASQQLLFPEVLSLSDRHYDSLIQNKEEIEKLGFIIKYISQGLIEVDAVPAELMGKNLESCIYDMAEELHEGESNNEMRLRQLADSIARSDTRKMDTFTDDEALSIIKEYFIKNGAAYTESGQIVIREISREELKKIL
ncbi:MAG: DNA mismatch repair endonuclease MutL [Alistipes sp.]|nr:DNA mismatch repair endonuclease MutL [Candidatus Alistipes equi]